MTYEINGTNLPQLSDVQTALAGPTIATPPVDFPWDNAAYPLGTVTVQRQSDGTYIGSCGLNKEWVRSQLGWDSWAKLYVSLTGNDTTGDGTQALPFRTLQKCIQVANASGVPTVVYASAGYWNRSSLPLGTVPTVHMVFIATGGRVVIGTFDTSGVTFAVDGTYANTYSASFSSTPARVFDRRRKDRFGNFVELTEVGSAAACNVRPNSWFWTASTLYINMIDGAAPTIGTNEANSNLLALRALSGMAFTGITSQKHLYFCGDDGRSGWDFVGGSASGAFRVSCNAATPGVRVIVGTDNCSGKYDGDPGTSPVNSMSTNCVNGLTIFTNCEGASSSGDAINFHDEGDIAYAANGCYHITVNCTGVDAGRGSTTRSANGITTHDRCIGIDIAGRYGSSRGVSAHNIDNSQFWSVGTVSSHSEGDIVFGGNIQPTEFRCDNSAKLWLDLCSTEPYGEGLGIYVNGGTVKTRRMPVIRGGVFVQSGSIGPY